MWNPITCSAEWLQKIPQCKLRHWVPQMQCPELQFLVWCPGDILAPNNPQWLLRARSSPVYKKPALICDTENKFNPRLECTVQSLGFLSPCEIRQSKALTAPVVTHQQTYMALDMERSQAFLSQFQQEEKWGLKPAFALCKSSSLGKMGKIHLHYKHLQIFTYNNNYGHFDLND